jgi:hypothetical protein
MPKRKKDNRSWFYMDKKTGFLIVVVAKSREEALAMAREHEGLFGVFTEALSPNDFKAISLRTSKVIAVSYPPIL